MLLARTGYRVLLLDGATFPSDTISSHLVHQTGLARIKRWGLLDELMATGCPPMTRAQFDMPIGHIAGDLIPVDGVEFNCIPRRHILDTLLVRAAIAAGAELREGFKVAGLLTEGDRVVGVRGSARGGPDVQERAAVVVGADGRNSTVARLVGAEKYRDDGTRTVQYYSYWADTDHPEPTLYTRSDWGVAVGPTHDGLTIVSMGARPAFTAEFRDDTEAAFRARIESIPDLAERLAPGHRTEPFRGLVDIPNFRRRSHGPGWVLAGDAGYYKDPVTAQGISDAFRDADELAVAIDNGLSGREDLGAALAGYQQARDQATAAAYDWTLVSTEFVPDDPNTHAFLGQVAGDPELSAMFVNLNAATADFGTMLALAGKRAARVT
jgi:2-polyprenyl-6-methoxyphenol hydroxylase-like FAD-dependent oxidoreductase